MWTSSPNYPCLYLKLVAKSYRCVTFQVGDFLLLHLLGQNLCSTVFGDILKELNTTLSNGNLYPTVPFALEMATMSPQKDKYMKDTNA
jgi:hypothetical protein